MSLPPAIALGRRSSYPVRFGTARTRLVHAGRYVSWDGVRRIEAAALCVQAPRVGDAKVFARRLPTCARCAAHLGFALPNRSGRA